MCVSRSTKGPRSRHNTWSSGSTRSGCTARKTSPGYRGDRVSRLRTLLRLTTCIAVFGLGCGRAQRNEDFVPSEDKARAALEATLQLWVSGDTSQEVPNTKPVIMVSDGHRAQKRKLTA